MEHEGEIWQEFSANGLRVSNGGIAPGTEFHELFGGAVVLLYRYINGRVEFLFQHRSKKLLGTPDKWDISAGGHINYFEPPIDSAVREAAEEIGASLEKTRLEFVMSYVTATKGIAYVYIYDWTGQPDNFQFNDQEVDEVRWVPYSDYAEFSKQLKPQLQNDPIFDSALEIWHARIKNRYENHEH